MQCPEQAIDGNDEMNEWLAGFEKTSEMSARASAAKERLMHERQVTLAEMMVEAERIDPVKYKSSAAQEVYARSSERYKTVLMQYESAIYIAESLRLEVIRLRMQFDAWRTNMANMRQQMGQYSVVA